MATTHNLFTMYWKKKLAIAVTATTVVVLLSLLWRSTEFQASLRAVKGFSFCSKDLFHLNTRHECKEFNPPLPNNTSHIIVTFVNTDWILLAQNWICSATRVGLHNSLYLIAVAPNVCSHFPTTPCYQHPSLSIPGALYAQPEYQKFMIERTKLILSILSCTKSKILLSDSDIIFLRNPIPMLNKELLTHDVFQEDSTGVHLLDNFATYVYSAICGGFMYLKPNNRTMDLFLSVLTYQLNWNWNDQSGINICIRWHGQYISWKTLDKSLFPNGKEFFEFNRSNKGAMVVHANFIRHIPNKIGSMMSQGVWCLKPNVSEIV